MAVQSVAEFVSKLSTNQALRDRLEDANLAELLAIARDHDLHFGQADQLYAHAKHSLELWGTAPAVSDEADQADQAVADFIGKVAKDPGLKAELESADLEQLLSLAKAHGLDLGNADDLYATAKASMEIW
ncbi:MAG: Nif11 family protein [Synechococcus lacustris]|jgi:uncharacterized protein YgfB (UPF0149 family)